MQYVASILKNMTSSKQNDAEKENNLSGTYETYDITTSESNKGTMDLNYELLPDNELDINDIDNDIDKKSSLNSQDQLSIIMNPENNLLKFKLATSLLKGSFKSA